MITEPEMPAFIGVLAKELEVNLRSKLVDTLTESIVEDFKKQVREIAKDAVKDITIEQIQAFRDLCAMREEIMVSVSIKEGVVC